jgi:HK97 family phage major capsid protein
MIKATRDLRDQKNTLAEAAQAAIDAKDFKKAKEIKDQIAEINDQIATVEALEEEKRRNPVKEPIVDTGKTEAAKKSAEERIKEIRGSNEYMVDFAKAMARRVTVADVLRSEEFGALKAVLTETGGDPVGTDGGFLVPLDFDKMVWEIKKTLAAVELRHGGKRERAERLAGGGETGRIPGLREV